jgi:ferredoxin-NADP reductase
MRQRYTARLLQKLLLSAPQQCYHLEFEVEALESLAFVPGQFISCVAVDASGKQQTRAYSLASAPRKNRFDLCLNRVEGGFFSNFLCDLEPGGVLVFDEPMGDFSLQPQSAMQQVENLFIATGTGIAPIRGFVEWLFPMQAGPRFPDTKFTLIYGTRHATELYYRDFFETIAEVHPNFTYVPTLSRADGNWTGLRGYVQEQAAHLIESGNPGGSLADTPALTSADRANTISSNTAPSQRGTDRGPFDRYAYVCGFRDMIAATRERLSGLGWARRQILSERYD